MTKDERVNMQIGNVRALTQAINTAVSNGASTDFDSNSILEAIVKTAQATFMTEVTDGKKSGTEIIDCEALISPWKKEGPKGDGIHPVGEVCAHDGQIWKCCQEHNTNNNPDIEPGKNPAHWVPYHTKDPKKAKPFVQPTMAEDAYYKDEVCLWEDGKVYRSILEAANTKNPADYPAGWQLETE